MWITDGGGYSSPSLVESLHPAASPAPPRIHRTGTAAVRSSCGEGRGNDRRRAGHGKEGILSVPKLPLCLVVTPSHCVGSGATGFPHLAACCEPAKTGDGRAHSFPSYRPPFPFECCVGGLRLAGWASTTPTPGGCSVRTWSFPVGTLAVAPVGCQSQAVIRLGRGYVPLSASGNVPLSKYVAKR